MSSALYVLECSTPWHFLFPWPVSNFSVGSNFSRVHRTVCVPSASHIRMKSQLNGYSASWHRSSTTFQTLEVRNISAGASLQALRFPQGRTRKLNRVRAENRINDGTGFGDDGEEAKEKPAVADGDVRSSSLGVGDQGREGGLSGMQNALSTRAMGFFQDFVRELKNETGFDSEIARDRLIADYGALRGKFEQALFLGKQELHVKLEEVREKVTLAAQVVQHRYWPQFVNWNRRDVWQDMTQWDVQRVGALVLYMLLFGAFFRGAHMVVTTPRLGKKELAELTDAYLESVIPEPTPANIRKLKKSMWREKMPEGFSVRKFKLGEDGEYQLEYLFPGDHPKESGNEVDLDADKVIQESDLFTAEEKEQLKRALEESKSTANLDPVCAEERVRAGVDINKLIDGSDTRQASDRSQETGGHGMDARQFGAPLTEWHERLTDWDSVLKRENIKETLDTAVSKYEVDRSWPEIITHIEKAKQGKAMEGKSVRAFWVAKKWWKHRPKLPYTYLLAKIENLEVRAAVYTDDLKKLYVMMNEGFPTDYIADLPVDPTLYQKLEAAGVEVDVLHRSDLSYYGRILLILLPSLLIICYIRELQYQARETTSEKIYDLLAMNRQHLILPEEAADKAKSQYKDVVVGGDIWQVIDEIMIYMRNPMKYHDRGVKLPRGILISGPPGTGKTLLARAIARESGLPFVFASGAEFVESGNATGTDKVFDVFFTARANAPSFVFIDEIDALAGKNAKDDAERRATFEQLLSELDGEPEDTDVDRFSNRQAVILICATNRPDELDEEFMRPGRIDREIHIGLPGEEERVGIFAVHSQGKRIAKDVDFRKLVFRTIGYSGADIRNLINEAGIMAVRKHHDEISQQDLIEVLDKQLFEGMGVVLMDEEQKQAEQKIPGESKRLLAVHEAGHVLLAHLFPSFDWHAFSHLFPGGTEAALSVFYPRQEMLQLSHTTVGYVMMQMVVAHGGRCAERLIFGDNISDGGQDDLARISGLARELTISPTNSRLGLLPLKWRETLDAPKLPGEVELVPNEWEKPGTHIVNMSVELSELFTREVTKYAEETEEIAMTALSHNRHILERLADVLLLKTKLSGFEAEDIIISMKPVLLPDFMNNGSKINFKSFEEKVTPPKMPGRYEELNIYPAPLHGC